MSIIWKLQMHCFIMTSILCSTFLWQIITAQSNCMIFFQECFEILAFCKYVYTCPYLKTTRPHEWRTIIYRMEEMKFFVSSYTNVLYALLKLLVLAKCASPLYSEKTSTSCNFFQKSWTKSCNWSEPYSFAKHAKLFPTREI